MYEKVLPEIISHAKREAPRESCGLIIVKRGIQVYIPCRNISDDETHFAIHPQDYADAEDKGEIVSIVHSHPSGNPPSEIDRNRCDRTGISWLVASLDGTYSEIKPKGYKAPLIGREWVHGVYDCYSLVQDYYRQAHNIHLPDCQRQENWWERGFNVILDNFMNLGFVEVKDIKPYDGVIMKIASPVPNHCGVILPDGNLLHQPRNRLSTLDNYSTRYRNATIMIVRHREFL